MSLFICDAAEEITTIVHNHTWHDNPKAVFLHLKISPPFPIGINPVPLKKVLILLSLVMLWVIIIMVFLCLEKESISTPFPKRERSLSLACLIYCSQQNEQNRSLFHSCHWENAEYECPAYSFWSSFYPSELPS